MDEYSIRILMTNPFGPALYVCPQRVHIQISSVPIDGHRRKMKSQPMRKGQTPYYNVLAIVSLFTLTKYIIWLTS